MTQPPFKLEKFRKELVNALELMSVELNNKNEAYQKDSKNLSDIVKQTKEQELIDMNKRIQDFQLMLRHSFRITDWGISTYLRQSWQSNKRCWLRKTVSLRIRCLLKELFYIFDETKSVNVMPLVKTKLGLK